MNDKNDGFSMDDATTEVLLQEGDRRLVREVSCWSEYFRVEYRNSSGLWVTPTTQSSQVGCLIWLGSRLGRACLQARQKTETEKTETEKKE